MPSRDSRSPPFAETHGRLRARNRRVRPCFVVTLAAVMNRRCSVQKAGLAPSGLARVVGALRLRAADRAPTRRPSRTGSGPVSRHHQPGMSSNVGSRVATPSARGAIPGSGSSVARESAPAVAISSSRLRLASSRSVEVVDGEWSERRDSNPRHQPWQGDCASWTESDLSGTDCDKTLQHKHSSGFLLGPIWSHGKRIPSASIEAS